MEFIEVLNKRKSTRIFQDREVDKDLIYKAIKFAQLAPSAGNLQSYKVIITKRQLTNINASISIIICANQQESSARYRDRGKFYSIQDATIFASYLQLVLVELGLASVWIGAFNEQKIKKILDIDVNLTPIAIIPLGYGNQETITKNRKSIEEIIIKEVN